MAETPAPTYRVAEATADGMSANLWLEQKHTHTIWCAKADDANSAARLLAQALNRDLTVQEVSG